MTYFYLLLGYFFICICESLPNNGGNRGGRPKYDNAVLKDTTQELADELSNLNAVKPSNDAVVEKKTTATPKAKRTVPDQSKQHNESKEKVKIDKKAVEGKKKGVEGVEQHISSLGGTELQKFELFPPEYVAKYIFETSDLDGVKTAIERLVAANKISEDAANSYTSKIKSYLSKLHEEAIRNMMAMETQKAENDALTDMLELSRQMNKNAQLEKMLYDYARQLYLLFAEKDDAFSSKILSRFMAQVQDKVKSGDIDQDVRDKIYAIVTRGITDAREADVNEVENTN